MSLPESLAGRLRQPVIGAPMFIVSGPELVVAQCKAGIIGAFPALNARPPSAPDEWLRRIETEVADARARHPERPIALERDYREARRRLADLEYG